MAFDMLAFHALPEPGGLRDQPVKLMRSARACLNVHSALRAYAQGGRKAGQMGKWKAEHPDEWDVVSEIRELRSKHGSNP